MVVLVTGASGQLGQALRSVKNQYGSIDFYFADSTEGDLTNPESLKTLFEKTKPDFCINAAAYTAVDKSESEPEKAHAINVDGVKNLAKTCLDYNCTLLHVSTDFVFNGNGSVPYIEDFPTDPQGVYGRTKRDGELEVMNILERYFIVRTSWVYSEFGNNFMKTMLRLASERDEISVVSDQIGTPTYAVDLAHALLKIITSGKTTYGIYNYSNEGIASWHDFAKEIFSLAKSNVKLHAIPTSSFPTPAKRPAYSVLDKSRIKSIFGLEIRDWKLALADAFKANS
ncbi:MAG: dTDP-4-dehydrorhamnose reductase [Flavobacterium sp.]|uniref:dTDP-4-dehydrorhamnose reductase n=1 Tax=Flavobacterium sp. TaxID=239 RepID=UPI00121500C9|nr:dTDP-4-dehydrorhamnose reductase [Flavobacterium sp.]RZJ67918.1 MAG: dTDP-4-dehydrorhamnose reductase [Flavobacterium sp.]